MTTIMKQHLKHITPLVLVAVLTLGLTFANLHSHAGNAVPQQLATTAAAAVVGSSAAGCGVLVGAVGGVIALAAAGATVGFGAALAISLTIHVGAILCAS